MQPFVVLGTLTAAALLVMLNSPALLHSASASPSHLALLPLTWALFFGIALAMQACPSRLHLHLTLSRSLHSTKCR